MLDDRDKKILSLLQANASTPVQDIAAEVALSPSACSRRISALHEKGYIVGTLALLDRKQVNLPTTIFVLVRTSRHTDQWLEQFQAATRSIPEIVEVHRLTGSYDYILKIVLPQVEYYDVVYKEIVRRVELSDVSAFISMETIKLSSGLPLNHV